MAVNIKLSKIKLEEWYDLYKERYVHELILIARNNLGARRWNAFLASKRVKAHGLAFEALKQSIDYMFESNDYEIDNRHIKTLYPQITGMSYQDFLAPVTAELERIRNELTG